MIKKARLRLFVACLLILTMLLPAQVLAAGNVDLEADSSLTISYVDGETPIVGARFDLYFVARLTESGDYVPVGDFADISVDYDVSDSEALLTLASTLIGYIDLLDIAPVRSGSTDENGLLKFEGLEPGLYLVRGYTHVQDGITYNTVPFLVYLPWYDSAAGEWIYDLTLSPKYESEPDEPDGEKVKIKVLKVWNDGGDKDSRPDEIVVHLLCDGEIYDTVILSEENNWRYTWEDLPAGHEWTVVEEVPDGYTVSITKEGITFVITNTPPETPPPPPSETPPPPSETPPPPSETPPPPSETPPPPSEPPGTPPPNIPQTGQLWWPVALLASAGVILFLIGYIRNRGANDET